MDRKQMRVLGIVLLVVCAICVFVALERYQANANAVKAMNQFQQSSPMGGAFGRGGMQAFEFGEMRPVAPTATKYAVFFAVLSGIIGIVLLAKSGSSPSDATRPPEQPPGTNG